MARQNKVRAKDFLTLTLMLAGTAAVGISVHMTLIAGVGDREARLKTTLEEKRTEVQEYSQLKQQEGALRSALEKSATIVTPIWKRATENCETTEEMIRLLYETALGHRVAIESATRKEESPVNAFFDLAAYDVAAVGDYHDLGHFLRGLEGGSRLLRIRTLKIAAQKDGRARASFDLFIYSLRQPAGGQT